MGKLIILFATILLSVYFTEQADFLSKERIDYINQVARTWKAKENFPPDTPKEQIIRLFGSKQPQVISQHYTKEDDPLYRRRIPKTFDSRTQWPKCTTIGKIRNQGYCASGWAHSTTGAFADRLCIKTNGQFNRILSAEELTFCCPDCGISGKGCNGGDTLRAWKFLESHGIVTGGNYNSSDGCQPYTLPPCIHLQNVTGSCYSQPAMADPVCSNTCYGDQTIDYNKDHHKVKNAYDIPRKHIQEEIITYGPISSTILVFDDFPNYKSGVYHRMTNSTLLGLHSVKIIGWGKENNVPYWLVVDSLGEEFGEKGMLKIRRGHNECGIEKMCTAGTPGY